MGDNQVLATTTQIQNLGEIGKRKISVVYATNTIIHHTMNLCEAFISNEAVSDFRLIITESLSSEYTNLGLNEDFDNDYAIDARKDRQAAINAINGCDLLIGTYYVNVLMQERIAAGKLTFILSERIFKPYNSFLVNLVKNAVRFVKYKLIFKKYHYHNDNIYFLLIGHYAPHDYTKLGIRKEHMLKFGYFPALKTMERTHYCADDMVHLLWVGRLVAWKHPEYAVKVCKYLTQKGHRVDLKIVGNGIEESALKHEAESYENIYFLGGLPTEQVRKIMSGSDIFLFTSSQAEGWGIVLNEAMSEGMCVIASESAGSTSELIKDGQNGRIYSLDSLSELKAVTEQILNHQEEIPRLGRQAQNTIKETWNAEKAVADLLQNYRRLNP